MERTVRHMSTKEMRTVAQQMTKQQALAFLERVSPHEFKARRVCNIVRRTIGKSKSKEFTSALDATLAAVKHAYDLQQQMTAMNPSLAKSQKDGTLVRKHNNAIAHLMESWGSLTALV